MVGKKPALTLEQAEHVRATVAKRRELLAQQRKLRVQARELRQELMAIQSQLRQLPNRFELAKLYDCAPSTIDNHLQSRSKNHEQERRARAANN